MVVRVPFPPILPMMYLPFAPANATPTRWLTAVASAKIIGTASVTGELTPYIGAGITRVGKMTGTTYGAIDTMGVDGGVQRTCETRPVKLTPTYTYVNRCLTRVKNNGGSLVGDSGGPVVAGSYAMGIHVSGTTPTCPVPGAVVIGCRTWFNSLQTARIMNPFGTAY